MLRFMQRSDIEHLAKTVWLTLALLAIGAAIYGISTHWPEITAILVVIAAWIASLPWWLWLCASILLGAHWIAKAIRGRP